MVDDFMLNKVLEKIKKISIEKFDDIENLIDTNDKLPNDITFKKVMILMTCVIKDDDNFYPQVFLDCALYDE